MPCRHFLTHSPSSYSLLPSVKPARALRRGRTERAISTPRRVIGHGALPAMQPQDDGVTPVFASNLHILLDAAQGDVRVFLHPMRSCDAYGSNPANAATWCLGWRYAVIDVHAPRERLWCAARAHYPNPSFRAEIRLHNPSFRVKISFWNPPFRFTHRPGRPVRPWKETMSGLRICMRGHRRCTPRREGATRYTQRNATARTLEHS